MDLWTIPFCVWHEIDCIAQIHCSSNLFSLFWNFSLLYLWYTYGKIRIKYIYRGKIKEAIIDNILNIYKCDITKLKFYLHLWMTNVKSKIFTTDTGNFFKSS